MSTPPDNTIPATPPRRARRRGCLWLLLVGGIGLLASLMPRAPQHAALRIVLENLLERQTQRQVYIGPIRGVLWFGAAVRGVSISEPGGFGPDGQAVMFSVGRVEVRYSLWRLILRRNPAACIARVHVFDPQGKITRTADGKIDLVELFRPPKKPEQPSAFRARVTVEGGTLHVFDQLVANPAAPGRPWHHRVLHELTDLQFAGAKPIRLLRSDLRLVSTAGPPLAGSLSARDVVITPEPLGIDGQLEAQRLALAPLDAYLAKYAPGRARLVAGQADLRGRIAFAQGERTEGAPPPKPSIELDLTAALHGASFQAEPLGRPVDQSDGTVSLRLTLAPDGSRRGNVQLDDLTLAFGGSRVRVAGEVGLDREPALALRLSSERLVAGELASLLPTAPQLQALHGGGGTKLDVRLQGPVPSLRIDGWVEPADVGYEPYGRAFGGRARVQIRRVAGARYGLEGRLAFDGLDLSSPRLGAPLRGLRGELRLAGQQVELRELRGALGGARLRADGTVVTPTAAPPRLALDVAADGLSPMALAPAIPPAYRPRAARGTLTAELRLNGPVNALAVNGFVRAPAIVLPQGEHLGGSYRLDVTLGPRPQGSVDVRDAGIYLARLGGPIEGLAGRLELRGDNVRLRDLRGRYGGAAVRADGTVAIDGQRFDLAVSTPGIRLETLTHIAGDSRIAGRGPLRLDLELTGSPRRMHLNGRVEVPRLRVPGVQIDRATAGLDLTVEPARGAAGLVGTLDLRETALRADAAPARLSELRGRFRFARGSLTVSGVRGRADGEAFAVSGTVRGLPRPREVGLAVSTPGLSGATLRRLAPKLPVWRDLAILQPVSGALQVAGPLDRLRLRGTVSAPAVAVGRDRAVVGGARASLDLVVGGPGRLPAQGTVRLHDGAVQHRRFALPVHHLTGLLRFGADGRIAIVQGSEIDSVRGRVGDRGLPFRLRGDVQVAQVTQLELAVDLDELGIDELRQAVSGLESPPEIEGSGAFGVHDLRLVGPLGRLRLTTGEGVTAGWIELPERLATAGLELSGGRARADLVIAENRLESGRVEILGTRLQIGATGTRVAALTGTVSLAGRRLTADLEGRIGGRLVRVEPVEPPAAAPDEPARVDLHLRAREVPLFELLPKLVDWRDSLRADRITSDLTVSGPLDNLGVAGQVLLAGGPSGVSPLRAEVLMRLLRAAPDAKPELFGGVRLAGGGLALADLDQPLDDITGTLSVGAHELIIDTLSARIGGGRLALQGAIVNFPRPVFDLRAQVAELNLGALLAGLRVPDPKQPDGPKVDFYTARGLPPLRTPEPVTGNLTLRGPRAQVAVGVDLRVPSVCVAPEAAMVEDRGVGADDPLFERRGGVLLADLRLTGDAVGSLERGAAPPDAEPPPLLDAFRLDLKLEAGAVNARQVVSFLSEKAKAETLGTLYAHQFGTLAVAIVGPARAPELVGSVSLPRLEYYGVPFRSVSLDFSLFDQVFSYTNGRLDVRGGLLRSQGAVALRPGEPIDLVAEVDVDGVEMAVLNAMGLPALEQHEIDGVLDGSVQIHLSEETPRVVGALAVRGLSVNGAALGSGLVDFAFEDKLLILRDARLADPASGSALAARGRAALEGDGVLDLAADIMNLDLAGLAPLVPDLGPEDLSGRLDFTGRVAGSKAFPLVTGTANVRFGSFRGYPFGRITAQAVEAGANGLLARLELSDPAYQAEATAELSGIDFRTGAANLDLTVAELSVDLARALPLVSDAPALADSSGAVAGTGHVTGRLPGRPADESIPPEERPSLVSSLRGTFELSAGQTRQPRRLRLAGRPLDAARLAGSVADNRLELGELRIDAGQTAVHLDGPSNRIDDLSGRRVASLRLVSEALRGEDIQAFLPFALRSEGSLELTAEINGPLSEPAADLTLNTHGLSLFGEPIPDRTLRARLSKQAFSIDEQAPLELFGCRLSCYGLASQEVTQLNADLTVLEIERVRAILQEISRPPGERVAARWQTAMARLVARLPENLAGSLQSHLTLSGSADRPSGAWTLDMTGVRAADTHAPVPDLHANVTINRPDPTDLGPRDDTAVYLHGHVDLRRDPVTRRREGQLALNVEAPRLDLASYRPWSSSLAELGGTAGLRGTITGTFDDPRVTLSQLAVHEPAMLGYQVGEFAVRELVLTREALSLESARLTSEGIQAELTAVELPLGGTPAAGETGLVALAGRLRRGEPVSARFEAVLDSRGELLQGSRGALALDGSGQIGLTLSGTTDRPRVNGRVFADVPRMVLAKLSEQPAERTPPAAAPAPEAEPPLPLPPGAEPLLRLAETRVLLDVTDNTIRFDQLGCVLQTGEGEPAGAVAVQPGGTIELRHLAAERLLDNPVSLRLEARGLGYRTRDLEVADVNLALACVPRASLHDDPEVAGWLNELGIDEQAAADWLAALRLSAWGWVNGGYVALGGGVGLRSSDVRQWQSHVYRLGLSTPPLTSQPAPPAFSEPFSPAPEAGPAGTVYPVRFARGGVGEVKLSCGLNLFTSEGKTPLTLKGQVDLFDASLREGMLGLFAKRGEGGEARPWPAFPALEVQVNAHRNNWIHTRVPQIDVPVAARLRVTDTPQQMKLEGTAQLGEGGVSATVLKSQVRVRGGEVRFAARRNSRSGMFEPTASIRAQATTIVRETGGRETYDVTIDLRGTVRPGTQRPVDTEWQISAESSPPLPEARVFALLSRKEEFAGAIASGQLQTFVRQELANAGVQAALGVALSPLLEEFREALGLDVLRLEYSLNGQFDIEAGQFLDAAQRVFVTVLVEVGGRRTSKQTVRLDYDVGGGVRVGAAYDTLSDFRATAQYQAEF